MDNNSETADKVVQILEEIRDNQNIQLERQAESMKIQSEQFSMARVQMEKAEKLQGRAEALQEKAGGVLKIILPIVVVLIVFLSWLIFQ